MMAASSRQIGFLSLNPDVLKRFQLHLKFFLCLAIHTTFVSEKQKSLFFLERRFYPALTLFPPVYPNMAKDKKACT